MKIDERGLYKIWKRYVNKNIYRVISGEHLEDVRKNGFDPMKDPFSEKEKKRIKEFFKIILRLHKKKVVYYEKVGRNKEFTLDGKYILERSIISMNSNFIDLTADYKQALKFKKVFKGGALTMGVYRFCNFLKDNFHLLNDGEKRLLEEVTRWTQEKRKYRTHLVFIDGTHPCLNDAKFYYRWDIENTSDYLPCPYGPFDHFKKVAKKVGIKKYLPYLKNEKYFYIRAISKIPKSAIIKIK